MMPSEFREKVFAFTTEKALFSAPCRVVVGVSGGPDSMALLHTLLHWPQPGLDVRVVHVHHGLREKTADRDAEYVVQQCEKWHVPVRIFHADVAELAARQGTGLEEAGRRERYRLFDEVCDGEKADYILTAHNADDQTETVLMHMLRGCGVDGLCGIPVARDRIRRPLLCCTRQEIEAYCQDEHIAFMIDETNADVNFTRNRIRHEVLPLLRELNPEADAAVRRLSGFAQKDCSYLNAAAAEHILQAAEEGSYAADAFSGQPFSIRRRMIRQVLQQNKIPCITQAHIEQLEQVLFNRDGAVSLPGAMQAVVQQGRLRFLRKAAEKPSCPTLSICSFPARIQWAGAAYRLDFTDASSKVHKLFFKSVIDCDRIQGDLTVRCRAEGDSMRPAGRGVCKTLKKLMNEWRIPAQQRDFIPLLCDDVGILLIPGYTCDERVRVTKDTKHFLVWNTDSEPL